METSSGSSVEKLMLSVENLSLIEGRTDVKNCQFFSPRKLPVPPPLFPGTIWGSNNLGDGWDFRGSRLQTGEKSFVRNFNSPSGSVLDEGASSVRSNRGLSDYSVVQNQEKLNTVKECFLVCFEEIDLSTIV
ncbi:hypothetical protein OIU76_018960 [Salix suchowensis]|nr:hypothetical protein OIU76_018960 [Salix suchowensis]